jgi:hypothetical protein
MIQHKFEHLTTNHKKRYLPDDLEIIIPFICNIKSPDMPHWCQMLNNQSCLFVVDWQLPIAGNTDVEKRHS